MHANISRAIERTARAGIRAIEKTGRTGIRAIEGTGRAGTIGVFEGIAVKAIPTPRRRGDLCLTVGLMAGTVSQPTREDAPWQTHTVANQPPPLAGVDVFSSNLPLVEATEREGAGWIRERAAVLGRYVGGEPQQVWGWQANEHEPVLRTHDRYGHRIDEVEFHPAWHQLMRMGVENELHALPWRSDEPTAHTARAALYMTAMQAEAGYACPITMTFAVVPALRAQPELAAEWEPLVTATTYDPRSIPAAEKGSAIAGMAMTEKQGGSDVRANTTFARPLNGGGRGRRVRAPGPQVVLLGADVRHLPRPRPVGDDEGLSCFLLPRILPDGTRNAFHIQRLKDKLGNRSNASSEIELHGAWAQMVGEPGRGVPTIIEMVGHTRLDCVLGAAAGMRAAVAIATHHAAHRSAFGKTLIDQPLMRNVLADLCLESEASTALAMRLARAYDEADGDAGHTAGRLGRASTTATRSCSSAWRPRSASTGPASARRTMRSRRWSASGATGMSRSRGCRACTARRRSPRSGRARAT